MPRGRLRCLCVAPRHLALTNLPRERLPQRVLPPYSAATLCPGVAPQLAAADERADEQSPLNLNLLASFDFDADVSSSGTEAAPLAEKCQPKNLMADFETYADVNSAGCDRVFKTRAL